MSSTKFARLVVHSALALTCQACATTAAAKQVPQSHPTSLAAASEIRRELLVSKDLPELPGWESRLYLVEFPAGAQSLVHEHPVAGVGYVLDGSFESAFGDAPATVVHAGHGFVDLPHEPHHFRNPDPSLPLRFVIAGTFRKGDPLFRALPQ
ncbi:MAG TPA: cupin domain-containing protein [Polyangiales bacterium]|nr:cupin domain-containing protein [Polyangiales bacterium]